MIPSTVAIYVAAEASDMRRSFDGLSGLVRDSLRLDPSSGALFLFFNRGADRLKLLWFDRTGFCILYKRLHRGTFRVPRVRSGARSVTIDARDLAEILSGVALPAAVGAEVGAPAPL